mmetsp:Transcript_6853/g.9983  ORF Transcript_6853/g.9983 Transcript_6853/m.9983 type:complete len:851 (-) Transcript_6853:106-2658(-)|eukprot:CAMPEP_0172414060 /NCGR_PEP_ID=MMETSP1064-20121228/701_1 /TAXON_ID=202472 /ORGANISM="Aulacoseira subarctica , Strain CCAP 1002/5" /LENGTH=850 /DNA_ID=CAMNT_0013150549 /DNA_START=100 /DNA_END=2652 /DNA_ORIENTATION=-
MTAALLPLLTSYAADFSPPSARTTTTTNNNGTSATRRTTRVNVSQNAARASSPCRINGNKSDRKRKKMNTLVLSAVLATTLAGWTVLHQTVWNRKSPQEDEPRRYSSRKTMGVALEEEPTKIPVFQPHPSDLQQPELQYTIPVMMSSSIFQHHLYTLVEQRQFLQKFASQCYSKDPTVLLQQWDKLSNSNQVELWKYCALYVHGGIFVEAEGVLLSPMMSNLNYNVAVLNSVYANTIHSGFIAIRDAKSPIAKQMIHVLVETSGEELEQSPLFLSQNLFQLISTDAGTMEPGLQGGDWKLWSLRCRYDPLQLGAHSPVVGETVVSSGGSPWGEQRLQAKLERNLEGIIGKGTQVTIPRYHRHLEHCPTPNDYCCTIMETAEHTLPLFLSRHPIYPFRFIPPMTSLPMPYKFHYSSVDALQFTSSDQANIPYISTVREEVFSRPAKYPQTPNFYEILQGNDCLPSDEKCSTCLRNKKGSNCVKCAKECNCFCSALCKTRPLPKFVSKKITVHPPAYAREMDRIVPRIIHQTWFEAVSKEKYPNMSRLIESWKQSSWEYRFYDDAAIESFLQTHFPSEIFQAYSSLIPGAFKADLFRYCVLLIYGGVYADMDVLLESNLESSIPPDVGFMTPYDAPGETFNKRHCLWNGLIAVAPAHPFMAKAIENVVNGIRNRFTAVDTDNLLCDGTNKPELSISHAYDTLFTAGPCILGMTINAVLGRNVQETFSAGEIVSKTDSDDTKSSSRIPGRSIILQQNKQDMGAHRFTLVERNLLVAATDMPDYDDRNYGQKQEDDDEKEEGAKENGSGGGEHYSKTHVKVGVYGLNGLYKTGQIADENIKISVSDVPSYAVKL